LKYKQISNKSEDFSHNYHLIRIKCPECVRTIKGKNHIRIHKSLSSFWWHFKTEHSEISNSQFNTDQIIEILKKISKAIHFGMLGFD